MVQKGETLPAEKIGPEIDRKAPGKQLLFSGQDKINAYIK